MKYQNLLFNIEFFQLGREDFLQKFGHKIILGNCKNFYYISNSAKPDMFKIKNLLQQFSMKNQVEDAQELPLSSGYDVLLSLLVPQPEVLDADWNVKDGVRSQLNAKLQLLK